MKTIIHIGYPKTGTTTLQHIVSQQKHIAYLGKGPLEREGHNGLSNRVLKLILCASEKAFLNHYQSMRDEVISWCNGRPLFISDEGLSFGKFMERQKLWGNEARDIDNTPEQIATRLNMLFPDYCLLVATREQAAFTLSYYKQHAKIGATSLKYSEWYKSMALDGSFFALLDYYNVICTYENIIGNGRVFVFPFEKITEQTTQNQLLSFLETALQTDCTEIINGLNTQRENLDTGRMHPAIAKLKEFKLISIILSAIPENVKFFLKRTLAQPHLIDASIDKITQDITNKYLKSNLELSKLKNIDYIKNQ